MLTKIDKRSLVLNSDRLKLRPLMVSDVTEQYVGWLNDDKINQYMETRHAVQTEVLIRGFVEKQFLATDTFLFGIFLKSDNRHIGNIKIGPVKAHHAVADLSLFVGDKLCWGKGYASEAIRAVARFGLHEMALVKLSAVAYSVNVGSINAFIKAGFKREGLRRSHYLLNGIPADLVEVGMIAEDLIDQ